MDCVYVRQHNKNPIPTKHVGLVNSRSYPPKVTFYRHDIWCPTISPKSEHDICSHDKSKWFIMTLCQLFSIHFNWLQNEILLL